MARERWVPVRAGLVSVWRYVEETFEFHRGRLLLRGPNGSGKSMALELLLPFLLDADTSPNRLTSAAKSRGGLFDRIMTGTDEPSRTGFVWVEFRRGDRAFTIGARMRASQSTRKVDVDYFTTTARIGEDLRLLDDQRVPLSLKALKEALGEHGRVHGSSDEHRNAVREELYEGFSADRYASVVTALLALRKEKLSQNLDLDKLSDVMSEALPPLADHDIAAVAEGFERLERRRAQLESLRSDLHEVDVLVSRQRTYARQVIAWLADDVRNAETVRDRVTRSARAAAEQLVAERDRALELSERDEALDQQIREARTEIEAYRDSDAYREGSRLVELRSQHQHQVGEVRSSGRSLERARERHERVEQAFEAARERRDVAQLNLDEAREQLDLEARASAADAVVAQATGIDDPTSDGADGERLIRAHVAARRQAIADVRVVLRYHERAVNQRDHHAEALDHAAEALDRAATAARQARTEVERATDAYVADVAHWVDSCRQLPVDRLRATLPDDTTRPAEVSAALAALREVMRGEHERTSFALQRQQEELDAALADLRVERDRLAGGTLVEPAPPAWRADRAGQPGSALWRAVDVVDGVQPDVLDGVEAAVVAAGLIDAWIRPDGSVDLDRADVTLVPAPLDGPTLRSVLAPLPGSGLDVDLVDRVLRSIRVVDTIAADTAAIASAGEVAIGRDGTFRVGAATGRGLFAVAELLGAEARERRRLARLAEVDARIRSNRDSHRQVSQRVDAAARGWAATQAEFETVPTGGRIDDAERSVEMADVREDERRQQLRAQRERLDTAERGVRDALRRLTAEASRHQVPADGAALDELAHALEALERAASAWAHRRSDRQRAAMEVDRADADRAEAAAAAAEADDAHEHKRRMLAELTTRVRAVEHALGSRYEEILGRIDTLQQQCGVDEAERRQLADERPKVERTIGGLERTVEQTEHERAGAEEHRTLTHRRLVTAIRRGIALDAGVETPHDLDGVTAVLAVARDVAASIGSIDTSAPARDRAGARVEEQLHTARQRLVGSDLERAPSEEGWTDMTAFVGGQRRRIAELAAALRATLDSATAELHEEEEQLFARVLAGDIRRALAARIRHANELVDSINRQLEQVRSKAGGVQARLTWHVDGEQPDAVRSARALLLRDPSDLTEAETTALQGFVRARVEQARSELEANAPWEARLRETLDYRRWHRFTLQIAHRDWEGYQAATPRRLQKLSTGERSIALHLPMLASIAAHYTAADGRPATCPRLIMLDELFAGVDPSNRSQLFARFTDWDLDAVFTSDHEWCQYATLDGIAIHHLHPPVGDEPVTSTRFTWDGHQRTIDPSAA